MSAPLDLPDHLFTCIDHVGVAVRDLDEAIALYRDAFGMEVQHQETNEEQGVREAMVAVGDSGSCIQLLAPLDESSTIAKFLDRHGPGMLSVHTTWLAAVIFAGFGLVSEGPAAGTRRPTPLREVSAVDPDPTAELQPRFRPYYPRAWEGCHCSRRER